ncbi:AAEL007181-PA, partial [Aedes aegypti]
LVPAPSTSNTIRGFVQLTPAIIRGSQKLPAHISIQTHTSASEEHDKRLDLIDSIVQQELNHSDSKLPLQQPAQPTMTEDIVKMLENNLPPGGVQESVLPITDNSILAALGSNDDGLPEDLLQHVAELAEHKELQEILDKQVLGVIGTDPPIPPTAPPLPVPSTSTMIPIPVSQQPSIPASTTSSNPSSLTNPESLPTMTVKEQLMPRKEAIQIRRSDGRIITLPPIEAPATRSAKRRAQAGTSSSASSTSVSAASHTTVAPSTSATQLSATQHSKSLMIDESRGKGNRSGTSSRRTSESSSTSGRVAAAIAAAAEDDVESDSSWNSEDDPNRLWCICKQPHNNRFMICCDTCEEWFHGKCVNITKAMGQQMEEDGVEWSCPNCSKKKQEKQVRDAVRRDCTNYENYLISLATFCFMTPLLCVCFYACARFMDTMGLISFFIIVLLSGSQLFNIRHQNLFSLNSVILCPSNVVAVSMSGCVVCGSESRISSVYCSDECIRKHAGMANSSVATTTPLSSTASSPTQSIGGSTTKEKQRDRSTTEVERKQDPTNVPKRPLYVIERKTGRCKNIPATENLKEWLLKNPTFLVVTPGSPQEAIILAKQAEVRKQQLVKEAQKKAATLSPGTGHSSAGKVQSQLKITDQKKLTIASPTSQPKQQQPQQPPKPHVRTFSRVVAGTPVAKAAQLASSIKPTVASTPKPSASSTPNTSTKASVKQPTVPEIEKFVEEVEEEMFQFFNKDTGTKYRAKYRTLVFNIKDPKNLSLFQKICEKRIGAKQLARMTPEELASQELAQWRENENKHQLEMIKKSELDLLACAKNYVLKTHKGEEVIEGKRDDRLQLDPTTAVEDVVAVLNNSTVSSTSEKESRRSRSRSRSRDRSKDRSRSRSKHKRRRSRSHERRSRSRDRDRDRERHHRDHRSEHHKSDHKSEHKSAHHKPDHKSEHHHHHHKKHDSRDSREKSVSEKTKEEASSKSFNLIDQILSSAGGSGSKQVEASEKSSKAEPEVVPVVPAEQDQEPTTTDGNVEKGLFVHWTGNVHMIDVASVEMSIRSVSGDVEEVSNKIPEDLEIVGTIRPEMVWNYIGQLKRQDNYKICLVRFQSNDTVAYEELYTNLLNRGKFGVFEKFPSAIKDFYICPLPAEKMIHMILKPLRGVGIIEGDKKPNLLLGIIVQIIRSNSGTASSGGKSIAAKTPRRQTKGTTSSSSTAVSASFALMQQVITKYATVNKKVLTPESGTTSSSPSGSPRSPVASTSSASVATVATKSESKLSRTLSESSDHGEVDMDIIKAPVVAKATAVKEPIAAVVIDDDDDEPYSPGGVSDDSDHFADVTAIVETKTPTLDSESERIRREMEEINRKIAEEKNEIVGIINKAELKEDEIKSTLDPSLITDIAIPSNLSEILASIKTTPSSVGDILKGGSAKETTKNAPKPSAVGTGNSSGTSRLAKLTEEELLRMVPDDSYLQPSKPTPSAIELDSDDSAPSSKKPKWDSNEPPPPGMEGDMDAV